MHGLTERNLYQLLQYAKSIYEETRTTQTMIHVVIRLPNDLDKKYLKMK